MIDFRGKNIPDRDFSNQDLSSTLFDSTTIFFTFNSSTGLIEGVDLSGTNAVLSYLSGSIDFGA